MNEKHLYKFGIFSLCAEEGVLKRNGDPVPITPKMFELLLVLVRNHGRIVEKEVLLKEVWPDSFVEEGNITFNVRQLRKALGDNAQDPIYIETIPRRGYRFMADVEELLAGSASGNGLPVASVQPAETSKPGTGMFLPTLIAGSVLLIGAIVTAAWLVRGPALQGTPILSAPFTSESLSTDGQVYHVVISPDGKNVVYTHRNGGKQSVWLRQLESSSNIQIVPPSDHFYGGLALSPDGNVVYFVRGSQVPPQMGIYRMPIFGGVPQKIADATQGWISLSPDGSRISFVRCNYDDDDYCSLFIADAIDGKNESKLVTRPRPIRIGDNKISPDGRSVAFASGQSRTASNEFGFFDVNIDTGIERELTKERFFNIGYIAWLPDHSGLLLTARKVPERNNRIWQVVAATGEVSHLTSDSSTYSRLSLDAKGTLLVSTHVEADFHLGVYRTEDAGIAPRVLTDASTVSYTPNGNLIISSGMTGDSNIWTLGSDGSNQRQLTNDPGEDNAPIVAPDNNLIFFESNRSGEIHVWRMNSDGTNQTQVTTQDGGFPLVVSPDGTWLYYRSALNNTLRRVALATGSEELVLGDMGRSLALSPDVSRVAFSERRNEGTILTVYSITDGKAIRSFTIAEAGVNMAHLVWSADGKYLAYILTDDKKENGRLWFQSVDSPTPRKIADLKGDTIAEFSAFALSPDGKSFAVIKGNWKHDAVLIKGLK